MGLIKEYKRHSARVTRSARWKSLRLQALERDDWKCVQCGERRRLEVDHIKPVRTHPELSFSLANLQCLCGPCHSRKTRIEIGLGRPDPKRDAWKKLVRDMQRTPSLKGKDLA
ncbi:HNH endonuclease [Donghicola tyrosinivorans]|uniref:Putative HNH nuclease YajD n=1 Tax=Donghicola tyrosinivorans TaxID=1652492 RepID=A0A2T0WJR7_9RHOB|nr:HNH endonuclease signature motif containing protein [Donghicola tyrosinivorans]PRY86774.1 5-methylcytosine-specific restriction endonuclease McrA [Donghicola tyrosinivorans]